MSPTISATDLRNRIPLLMVGNGSDDSNPSIDGNSAC